VRTVAERLAGETAVVQIDTQENPGLATRFGVQGIPVVMLLRDGRVIDRLPGARSAEAVLAWFRQRG
jgi:thioredoxin 2